MNKHSYQCQCRDITPRGDESGAQYPTYFVCHTKHGTGHNVHQSKPRENYQPVMKKRALNKRRRSQVSPMPPLPEPRGRVPPSPMPRVDVRCSKMIKQQTRGSTEMHTSSALPPKQAASTSTNKEIQKYTNAVANPVATNTRPKTTTALSAGTEPNSVTKCGLHRHPPNQATQMIA